MKNYRATPKSFIVRVQWLKGLELAEGPSRPFVFCRKLLGYFVTMICSAS